MTQETPHYCCGDADDDDDDDDHMKRHKTV